MAKQIIPKKMLLKEKTGLFFGSFNPFHSAHLIIADYMLKFTDINEIWFVISPQNPFKQKNILLDQYQRLQLVNLAIQDNSKLKVCDIEFKLTKPSYTINTLNYIKEKYPKKQFLLIMGSDNLKTFYKWKDYRQIIKNYELYVYPRYKSDKTETLNKQIKIIDAPLTEISSSFIRDAIKNKKDVKYMLPVKVYDYIKKMHFYKK